MNDEFRNEPGVDEYLWPLTGNAPSLDWATLAEQMKLRERLAEIRAHVDSQHVRPRLQRLGPSASAAMQESVRRSIIEGWSPEGYVWTQHLKAPVPAALRDEWEWLAQRLRVLQGADE